VVEAELSAVHHAFVDREGSYTTLNTVARLIVTKSDVNGRLIRRGCLFSDANRAGLLGDRFSGAALPRDDRRSPATVKSDCAAYEAIVNLVNYRAAFRLDAARTRAVVEPVLHVVERSNHYMVQTMQSAMKSDWQIHSFSATHGHQNTTMKTYAGYIQQDCA